VSIQLAENVAFWHYAHSYARGHTRRSVVPWLLQKSCHDLDLLAWMAGAPAASVSSFLRPTELTDANAPEGAPDYCIEGCPHAETCPYDAVATYRDLTPVLSDLAMAERPIGLGLAAKGLRSARPRLMASGLPDAAKQRLEWWRWPVAAVTDDHTPEGLDHALRTTRWGRCAYKVGDNDQPSAQTVSIRFTNGVLANFTLQSNSHRTMRTGAGERHARFGMGRAARTGRYWRGGPPHRAGPQREGAHRLRRPRWRRTPAVPRLPGCDDSGGSRRCRPASVESHASPSRRWSRPGPGRSSIWTGVRGVADR
jgi:predicted dehydrogenase